MASNVQMVFRGEVLEGFDADEVRRRVAQALQLDEARMAQMFSGARTVLKRSVEPTLARGYVDKLARLGARVHLEPADALSSTSFTPLPDLPELPAADAGPTPPPWGTPPRPTRPAPLSAAAPIAAPGPIPAASALSLKPVAEEIACPNCGERQSKRLLCRSCSTNMEMAQATKDEAAAQVRAARQAAFEARHRPRSARPAAVGAGSSDAGFFGLTFDGRMGRLKYATANLVMMALLYMPLIMMLQRPTLPRIGLFAIAALLFTVFGMRLAVLRCHDCDKTGWWSILLWIPSVNFLVTLVLALAPGSDGENDYGPPTAPASWAGFGVAALCAGLLFALSFSSMMKAIERMQEDDGDDDAGMQFQYDPRAASLPKPEAQAAFNESYLPAGGHKAFAASPSGGWGWVATQRSQAEAARGALLDCESRRPPYTAPCALVNMNGQWAAPER